VVGIPSLDILAMNAPEDHSQICVLCDAKRNLVYACLYEKRGEALKRKSEYLLTDIQDVLKRMKGEALFIGDGAELFKTEIQKAKEIKAKMLGEREMFPQARALALLALPRLRAGKHDPTGALVPLYLYPDHCQIQKR
jgi:tRNA threonylcarbamoyladenosine biosynthesis protein TsaB